LHLLHLGRHCCQRLSASAVVRLHPFPVTLLPVLHNLLAPTLRLALERSLTANVVITVINPGVPLLLFELQAPLLVDLPPKLISVRPRRRGAPPSMIRRGDASGGPLRRLASRWLGGAT